MKKLILYVFAAVAICGCADKGYAVTGQAGEKDGEAVLQYMNPVGEMVCDTVAMTAGAFKFTGKVDDVCSAGLVITPADEAPVQCNFYLENTKISVKIDLENVIDYGAYGGLVCIAPEVEGGRNNAFACDMKAAENAVKAQPEFAEYVADQEALVAMGYSDVAAYRAKSEEIRAKYDPQLIEQYYDARMAANLECVKAHPDCEAAAMLYGVYAQDLPLDEFEAGFEGFTPEVKASAMAKDIVEEIAARRATAPGSEAPDFTLKDREGNDVTLSSLRGKYVIIDFWASWCRPCRAGMPAMKQTYAKYHDKGLEILGVSVDSESDKWTAALDQDQLPWINVIDEFPAQSKPARVISLYGVHYIPCYFLVDPEGKIIGQMEHDALEEKLAELLK